MTFDELLLACANGFIEVKSDIKPKYATSNIGKIVVIKDNGRHQGCSVQFPGMNWDTWFTYNPEGKDKRTLYMHQLDFTDEYKRKQLLNELRECSECGQLNRLGGCPDCENDKNAINT